MFNKMPPIKSGSSKDSSLEKEKNPQDSFCDPIGKHTIALRKFYSCLIDYNRKFKAGKFPGPMPNMPEYPTDYPTPELLRELRNRRKQVKQRSVSKNHISKKKMEEMRTFAIKTILLQIGFDVENMKDDDSALVQLSHVVNTFLQNFVNRLRHHKDSETFCNSTENEWSPIETTLQECGLGGVSGLAKYFYDDFVKMHDALFDDCIKKQLEVINAKPPVPRNSQNSETHQDTSNSSADTVNIDGNELSHNQ